METNKNKTKKKNNKNKNKNKKYNKNKNNQNQSSLFSMIDCRQTKRPYTFSLFDNFLQRVSSVHMALGD